ncbi:MAG: ABC transporter permease, partial [Ruminiclostridium sp.]|nr:ABC transporter permease [Ruminiclostridium sp.]
TRELTEYISNRINSSDIVKEQQDTEEYDVFTGLPFKGTEPGDKAEADAKAAAEEKKREIEEFRTQLTEAAEQMRAAQEQLARMQEASGQMPDMQALMESMSPEEQAAFAQMTPEEQQAFMMSMMPESEMPELPDMSSIIAMLPEEQQEQLSGMTPEEQMSFLMELSGEGATGSMSDMSYLASGFDLSDYDFSSFDMENITDEQMSFFMSMTDEQRAELMKQFGSMSVASNVVSNSSQFENLRTLGVISMDTPSSIAIYPLNFEAKERIVEIIADYNSQRSENDRITYTDIVGMLMSSVTDIVNAISYILIAFVAISLIVSSIMIGIITYISVLERTKEIGILRSIGASKKDISRVFNAETIIIGFIAGGLGIGVTLLLLIPINLIIENITDIVGLAILPPLGGAILIAISVILTLIAGLFPSSVAAKKDPVVALRTE